MWIFSTRGFYSVVSHQGDSALVVVRARVKKHLENLKREFSFLRKAHIVRTPDADYRWRVVISHAEFVTVASQLAAEIDYTNFKQAVLDRQGRTEYEDTLHRVWSAMYELQCMVHPKGKDKAQCLSQTAF